MDEDDFDLGGFDEAYSPDDFSQADMDFATAVGQQTGGFGDDNTAQVIANQLAQPQVGMNRSNVRGMANYDPTFAAAFDISRGLDPTGNFQGTGGLAVPSYLRPQIESGRVDARGEPIRYSSEFERVLQEDVTDFVQSGPGIVGLIGNFLSDNFNDAKKALGLDGGAKGGLKTEDLQPDKFISGMSQQGAGMSVTDPVVSAPATVNIASVPQVSPMFDQFGNPYRSGFDRNIAEMAQQNLSGGIASVAPNMAQDANIQVADASQFLNPQAISRGLNYFAGPQIQDFFRGVTNNPNTTIRLGPGFDMNKREVDDNIFSINIPFATG